MRKRFDKIAKLGEKHLLLKPDHNIGSHLQKLTEEIGELAQSINKLTDLKSFSKNETIEDVKRNILEEVADCNQILFIIAHLAGFTYDDVDGEVGLKNKSYKKFIKKLEMKYGKKSDG